MIGKSFFAGPQCICQPGQTASSAHGPEKIHRQAQFSMGQIISIRMVQIAEQLPRCFSNTKDFRTGDLFDKPAKEENRRALIDQTVLPPGKAKNPVELQAMKSERVVVISDLPFNWKSNNGNINDITSLRHGDGIMSHTTAHRTMIQS